MSLSPFPVRMCEWAMMWGSTATYSS